MKKEPNLARRATGLSTAFPAPHFPAELDPSVIAFDSRFAFPDRQMRSRRRSWRRGQ
jgi:hypothetical protein